MSSKPEPRAISENGITVLSEPEDQEICVDIVFVHGLQGHPRKTWSKDVCQESSVEPEPTASLPGTIVHQGDQEEGKIKKILTRYLPSVKKSSPPSKQEPSAAKVHSVKKVMVKKSIFWLEDFLIDDCPSARIMTFGYNSIVTRFFGGPVNQDTFYNHATNLLLALHRKRLNRPSRPLIFVAHSLGGIIVKQALVESDLSESRPELQLIEESTSAIIFLGTPHRGSDYAHWGKLAQQIASAAFFDANGTTIEHLKPNGEQLFQLEKNFARLMGRHTFKIHTFQEAQGLMGVKGLNSKVVETWSATIGDQQPETIDANHMEMCRFGSKVGSGYEQIGAQIQTFVEEARETLEKSLAKERESILSSLYFPELHAPHVSDPYGNTCRWVINHSKFQDWFNLHHGIFWIKGKPGSGKSTLTKHLCYSNVLNILPNRVYQPIVKISFFFNARGTDLERSIKGMLQALLYQILDENPKAYRRLLQQLREHKKRHREPQTDMPSWTPKTLTEMLVSAFQTEDNYPLILFVDALDECEEATERGALGALLRKFLDHSRSSKFGLKICCSSRPDASIDLYNCNFLSLQEENRQDICTFVENELASRSNMNREVDYYKELAQLVIEKADGVFLWVILVVPRLRRAINCGDTLRSLRYLLEEIPAELEDLFRDILRRIGVEHLSETMRMIQLAILVQRPLNLEEFRHVYAFGPGCSHRKLSDWEHSEDFIESGEQMKQLIQSRSGGLLEAREGFTNHNPYLFPKYPTGLYDTLNNGDPRAKFLFESKFDDSAGFGDSDEPENSESDTNSGYRSRRKARHLVVRLIHETAKSFFTKGDGFRQISLYLQQSVSTKHTGSDSYPCKPDSYLVDGHDFIARTCFTYLELRDLRTTISQLIKGAIEVNSSRFPFAKYAIETWLYHAGKADEGGMSQEHLLGPLILWSRTPLDIYVFWAADNNILSWIELLKGLGADFDTPTLSYGSPIRTAVKKGYMDMVSALINCGANVNGITGGIETTMRMAYRAGNDRMATLLRERGGTLEQVHWLPPPGQLVRL